MNLSSNKYQQFDSLSAVSILTVSDVESSIDCLIQNENIAGISYQQLDSSKYLDQKSDF